MTLIKAAVTFNDLTEQPERPDSMNIEQFVPKDDIRDKAEELLKEMGFTITLKGHLTLSIQGSKEKFEEIFQTTLSTIEMDLYDEDESSQDSVFYPMDGEHWNEDLPLYEVIDQIHIQWPYYFLNNRFNKVGSMFPTPVDYHHLRLPGDVSLILNAQKAHRTGTTGDNVKVVIIDSGFNFGHHYFDEGGYNTKVVLGHGAADEEKDLKGHGTAMAANLLAVAPDVELVGIKLLRDREEQLMDEGEEEELTPQTTLVEAFELALSEKPDIISLSLSGDLANRQTSNHENLTHFRDLPNSLKALEGLVLLAIKRGITVVCAAGNWQVGFPAMIPEVISVGGVHVDEFGEMAVSNYTSAYTSKIYPDRKIPDLCGLSGMTEDDISERAAGGYIMSPVQKWEGLDIMDDGTHGDDAWAVVGGSSTATAQIAGVCALIKQENEDLSPFKVKQILMETSRPIIQGKANLLSNVGHAVKAIEGAAGSGLVNAFEAVQKAKEYLNN